MDSRKKRRRKNEEKKRKRRLSDLILLLCLIVFCVAGGILLKDQWEYYKGRAEYDDLRELALGNEDEDDFSVDFDALKAINSDVVAWIRFDEPSTINYPVVQTTDNETYLHRSFGANYIKAGTIFVDAQNAGDFSDKNTFLYGHHMNDGSMFAGLLKYKEENFHSSYPYFYIYTPDGESHRYLIFAVEVANAYSDIANKKSFESEEDFLSYVNLVKEESLYDTGVIVEASDQIVTLYTCTNGQADERFLVFGKRLD